MTTEALKFISDEIKSVGINYEFGEWSDSPVPDPYFIGEYIETPSLTESGLQEATFILTGTGRSSRLLLEKVKEKVERLFDPVEGKTAILPNGNGLAVFYSDTMTVPVDDAELKRIQINLQIKEWKVT